MIWIKAKEKGLEFKLHVDSSIPSMLCGDEVRIKQILINLLNNAVKYTSEGSVTLSVRCERQGVNRMRVWYSVEDTGQGVKKENIPYIFNAFRRVDEEKNRHIEGTGLGLSIVQQLVELMGGEISVNSVYTKGSKFIVTLEQDIVDDKDLGTFTLASWAKLHDSGPYRQSFASATIDNLKDQASDKFEDLKDKAGDIKDQVADKAGDIADKIKDKSGDLLDSLGDTLHGLADKLKN